MKKIAIVTGASSGIGKAVALDLAKHYHVILVARSEDKLKNVQAEIIKNQGEASYYVLNVSDANEVQKFVAHVVQQFNRIDILFNNAGILKMGTSDINLSDLNEVIQVNLLGAIYVGNAVALQMKKQQSGYIINLSSLAGKRGLPTHGIYSASKFGLAGYSESLFKELIPYGVKVTTICPSTVATEMTKSFPIDQQKMITTEDIVKTVNYLLSLGKTAVLQEVLIYCPIFEIMGLKSDSEKLVAQK